MTMHIRRQKNWFMRQRTTSYHGKASMVEDNSRPWPLTLVGGIAWQLATMAKELLHIVIHILAGCHRLKRITWTRQLRQTDEYKTGIHGHYGYQ